MWETHTDFSLMVMQSWQNEGKVTSIQELQQKLTQVAGHMQGWGRSSFGHVKLELNQLKDELARLQADPTRIGPSHVEIKVTNRIIELNHR
jgi:hypothetical protein